MAAPKKQVRHRDAKTGHYVKESYAKKNPNTTVRETDKKPKK